ncbi:interferon-stimulated 20 kDa exonuclease-like 2 [Brienomyrus brachyistius]|uniref:interferon-stimulated 20 kDa exonuclease-like 2 n=1 Tax=Brienomyrus brachyistius TaxID=42636 RepID=UPI0020B3D20B|nr:interferon-stimulated 20 kDa exonuclease-like 2 [Brienomyrus brachyistius]XP_048882207.1 interferon-stimulated 20 kDa exonuclease-like 2 [Brienomyrus brachyistius]XP_048882208.1 interferon-stimulated 20 kDa exonuclease-like 2 [Brienomyrus brachyistius]
MSELMFNLEFSNDRVPDSEKTTSAGKQKHSEFLKRRRFLERKGLLGSKQHRHWQSKEHAKEPNRRPDCARKRQDIPFVRNPPATTCAVPKTSASQSTQKLSLSKECSAVPHSFSQSSLTIQSKERNGTTAIPKTNESLSNSRQTSEQVCLFGNPHKYVALDCEMVGTGPKGRNSELARCSIVSYNGDVVYDKYVSPSSPVTDFRTRWSGIKPKHLHKAASFNQARFEILKILKEKVVVGHSIQNDFKVLHYTHPPGLTRDIATIPLLSKKAGFPEQQTVSLKKLSRILLKQDIQVGKMGHSSVEDAKASMDVYKTVEVEWEQHLAMNMNVGSSQS